MLILCHVQLKSKKNYDIKNKRIASSMLEDKFDNLHTECKLNEEENLR